MNYIDALRKISKKLDAEFNESELITHSPSKGAFREYIVKNCIRPFLPDAYGISNGECFDYTGAVSKQLDAVIYDRLYSYVIPYGDDFIQFPYESVYGNIEIKSMLNKDELFKALDNIESFKKLTRKRAEAAQVIPNRSFDIKGVEWNEEGNYYEPFGIIFAFSSNKPESIIKYLGEKSIENVKYLPNIIVLYNERTIIFRIKYEENESGQSGWYVNFTDDFDGFVAIPCGEDTLPIFITSVLIYSSFERISSMDIPELINPIIDDALHRGESYKQYIFKKK